MTGRCASMLAPIVVAGCLSTRVGHAEVGSFAIEDSGAGWLAGAIPKTVVPPTRAVADENAVHRTREHRRSTAWMALFRGVLRVADDGPLASDRPSPFNFLSFALYVVTHDRPRGSVSPTELTDGAQF